MYYCYFYVVQVHQLGPSTLLPLRKNRGARGGLVVVDDEAAAAPRGCFEAAIQCKSKPSQLGRTQYTHIHTLTQH